MAITKREVRDWLERKLRERRSEIARHIEDVLALSLDPVIDVAVSESIPIHTLSQVASRYVDLMRSSAEKIPYLQRHIRPVTDGIRIAETYGIGLHGRVKSELREIAKHYIKNPNNQVYTIESAGNYQKVYDVVVRLVDELRPEYKKLRELNTLERELNNVITVETSGKRAYKALVAAGVDMAGFEEEHKRKGNLPMVVKLSADVCVLNANC